jgi:chorismate dehydratase
MTRDSYSIALVNYLNAKPFLYGLQNGPDLPVKFDVSLLNPADCAKVFSEGKADIALVPVGALQDMRDYKIITDYGIAAWEEVRTVCLFSDSEPKDWNEVFLDDHSRTSVLLSKLLIKNVFGIQPGYTKISADNFHIEKGKAILLIGDKVFSREKEFAYTYDLAKMWFEWTGLPFVFAVWIARNDIPDTIVSDLNTLLKFGTSKLGEVIKESGDDPHLLKEYYERYIRYYLDEKYRKGLHHFLSLINQG